MDILNFFLVYIWLSCRWVFFLSGKKFTFFFVLSRCSKRTRTFLSEEITLFYLYFVSIFFPLKPFWIFKTLSGHGLGQLYSISYRRYLFEIRLRYTKNYPKIKSISADWYVDVWTCTLSLFTSYSLLCGRFDEFFSGCLVKNSFFAFLGYFFFTKCTFCCS